VRETSEGTGNVLFEDFELFGYHSCKKSLLQTQEISFIDHIMVLPSTPAFQTKWSCVHDLSLFFLGSFA